MCKNRSVVHLVDKLFEIKKINYIVPKIVSKHLRGLIPNTISGLMIVEYCLLQTMCIIIMNKQEENSDDNFWVAYIAMI